QTIKDDPATPPEQQHILDIINRSGKHLLQLINDVLDMSKIEAGRTRLEMEDFDLGELIRDIIDMMRIRAEEKGLVLRFNQSSQFPRFIHADAPKLRQILLNLLSNAVKFTEKGEVTLRLGCDNNHPDTISLRGEVEDSGSGIATEDLERIFLPFEQLSNASSQIGTGLGLAIARQFVDLMGGQIAVESKIGRGSLFRFTVQVQHALTEPPLKSGTETGRIIGLEPGQPEYRILISEDQPDNQLLLQRLLKQIGFKVRVTDNGEQAIKEFQQWHPHFIWMDQRMPVMDGLTATYRIRELPGGREVKIVALTASLYRDKGHKPGDGPLDDYLLKPYRAEELFGCMARQLGVRYVYERQDPTLNRERISRQELSFEAMSSLPLDLLAELHTATVSLDVEETTALIERVAERDPGLATTLAILVEELNFKPIQQLLQKLETEN
ncbi:MAG: ATP-binding protein, partial [Thermodesulfobacteriota bacterium]